MTQPITPKRAHAIAIAATSRLTRITPHTIKAITTLHNNQPGYPSTNNEPRGKGGYSDPTANLAISDDHARRILDEVTHLFNTLDRATERLDVLVPNWANAHAKWEASLRTEATAQLANEHNWCDAHMRAGLLEPARVAGGRLCRRCEADRSEIGADPPVWMIEKRHNGRNITTIDMAKAKREAKPARKRKR